MRPRTGAPLHPRRFLDYKRRPFFTAVKIILVKECIISRVFNFFTIYIFLSTFCFVFRRRNQARNERMFRFCREEKAIHGLSASFRKRCCSTELPCCSETIFCGGKQNLCKSSHHKVHQAIVSRFILYPSNGLSDPCCCYTCPWATFSIFTRFHDAQTSKDPGSLEGSCPELCQARPPAASTESQGETW